MKIFGLFDHDVLWPKDGLGKKWLWIFDSDTKLSVSPAITAIVMWAITPLFPSLKIWTLLPECAVLWMLGGGGVKPVRRYGVPLLITAYAVGYGMPIVKTLWLLPMLLLIGFGPGYGDPYVKRLGVLYWPYIALLGFLWGICQFGLSVHFGNYPLLFLGSAICSLVFAGTMAISKRKLMPWKVAEGLTGAAVGLVGALLIHPQ